MKELVGKRFTRWVVISYDRYERPHHFWVCRCDCGTEKIVQQQSLGVRSFSCGCLRKEIAKSVNTTHGKTGTPIYKIWYAMMRRCYDKRQEKYKFWGGRGIRVCKKWHDFKNFYEDMGPLYKAKLSIDRIDNNGNYEPSNCRWTTPRIQARNRRNAHLTDSPWGRICLSEAAEKSGLCRKTIYNRIKRGLTGDELWQTWYLQN